MRAVLTGRLRGAPALALVLAVQTGVLLAVAGSVRYADDLASLQLARRDGIGLTSLLTPVGRAVSPGHRLLSWVTASAGGRVWPVQLLLVAAAVASAWLLARLLRRLYGPARWVPAVVLVVGVSVAETALLTTPGAAQHVLPALLLALVAVDRHLSWRTTGHRRMLVLAVASVVAGSLFALEALLAPVVVVAIDGLPASTPATGGQTRTEGRRGWPPYLLAVGAVGVLQIVLGEVGHPLPAAGDLANAVGATWLYALGPGLLGRALPPIAVGSGLTLWDAALVVVSQVVVAVVVTLALVRHPARWRTWAALAALTVLDGLLLAVQATPVGSPRTVLPVLLGLALLVPAGVGAPVRPESPAHPRVAAPPAPTHRRAWAGSLALLAVVALTISSLQTAWLLAADAPSRTRTAWLDRALADIDGAGTTVDLVDGPAPAVLVAAEPGHWRLSEVLPLFADDARFDGSGRAPLTLADDGRLIGVDLRPFVHLDGAALPSNPLVAVQGPGVARGTDLCLSRAGTIELTVILDDLQPAGRYVGATFAGPPPARVTLATHAREGPDPDPVVVARPSPAALLPLDTVRAGSFGMTVDGSAGSCLVSLDLGTLHAPFAP